MKIYSTISREKERLETIHSGRINFFVCGPTVYDDSHIGHARTYIAFDVVARYLKYRGYSVFYLQNITDVDDKIIARAAEKGISPRTLARRFEQRYMEDMQALGVTNVNYYARATEHIPEIISQIERLKELGFAYETQTGIYFDESLFPDFGKLSHQSAEDLKKHRIEPDPTKRNSGDFALWKKRQTEDGGSGHAERSGQFDDEIAWDSPWGKGRPGWHIEDTAIAETYFGQQYDIHGGAMDLIFPHHEAEIAQMEAASGKKPMVRYWMHTGFLNVNEEKMSKSLGNFFTVRDLLDQGIPGEVIRFVFLMTHYRSPMDWTAEKARQAEATLREWWEVVRGVEAEPNPHSSVVDALADDLNTAQAITHLHEQYKAVRRGSLRPERFLWAARLLGLLQDGMGDWAAAPAVDLSAHAARLASLREAAMATKDFAPVDALKSALLAAGVEVRMSKAGVELVPGPGFDAAKLEALH